jgi:hypothetical protein
MAGVLNFSNYVGGADNLQIEQTFPSNQRKVVYDFGQNIAGWNFHLDYQTIVADTVAFDRITGEPNFSNTKVIGSFNKGVITTATYVTVLDEAAGTVAITFPKQLYTGPILPDARSHIPITIVGITWTDAATPSTSDTHRWAFIQSFEPGVEPGDPVLDNGYAPITVGG